MPQPTDPKGEPEFYVTDDLPLDYEQNVVRGGTQTGDAMTADKVHRLAAARRNAYRRRSWFAISAVLLLVATIKMISLIVGHVHTGDVATPRVLAYTIAGTFMLLIAARLTQRAVRLTRRLRESDLDEPTEVPDFTPLGSKNADAPVWHRASQN